ncbi:GPI mannosyltransferase-like protein, partial [Leptotrombidium deliense]
MGSQRSKSLVYSFFNYFSFGEHLFISTVIRFLFILYGLIQDKLFHVKYTDIDYVVFTDGARYLSEGRSPFLRHGYRYTPLFAYILLPNIYCFHAFGKIVFTLFDVLTGLFVFKILNHPKLNLNYNTAKMCACLWFYNPLPLIVSTRGSSDSMITFLVLLTIYLLINKNYSFAGLVFGLVVHCKLYTLIYTLSLYFYLNSSKLKSIVSPNYWLPLKSRKFKFVIAAVTAFVCLTYASHVKFGKLYLQEAWIYHLQRKDIQHNFSPYFYVYHLVKDANSQQWIGYLAFIPQALSILYYSFRYSVSEKKEKAANLFYALFCETFMFVTLNKVCTSQYFLWYLCLLPLIACFLRIDESNGLKLLITWLIAQLLWLFPAYFYEFRRFNCLHIVWLFSIVFLCVNLFLLFTI